MKHTQVYETHTSLGEIHETSAWDIVTWYTVKQRLRGTWLLRGKRKRKNTFGAQQRLYQPPPVDVTTLASAIEIIVDIGIPALIYVYCVSCTFFFVFVFLTYLHIACTFYSPYYVYNLDYMLRVYFRFHIPFFLFYFTYYILHAHFIVCFTCRF